MFLECFKEAYGVLKKVCFVFVVRKSSQLPEQKEGLFNLIEVFNEEIYTTQKSANWSEMWFLLHAIVLRIKMAISEDFLVHCAE